MATNSTIEFKTFTSTSTSNWTLTSKIKLSAAQLSKNPKITIREKEGSLYALVVIENQYFTITPDISMKVEKYDIIDPQSFRVLFFTDSKGDIHKRFIGTVQK